LHRIHLTSEQADELHGRTRAADLKPRTRDRLEMVRLCAAGYRVAEIARLLRLSPQRVRGWLRRFRDGGFDALPDRPHPGRPGALTPALLQALREELARANRTWTAKQIAQWLVTEHGVSLHPDHLATQLKHANLSYKRTERSLKHEQDATAVAAASAELQELEKGGSGSARPGAPRPSGLCVDPPHPL
jgi:transposase